jgi:hypothetical protein
MELHFTTCCCVLLVLLLHHACRKVQRWHVLCWTCWRAKHVSHLPHHTMQSSRQQQMKMTGAQTGVAINLLPLSGFCRNLMTCKQHPYFKR